MADNKVTQFLSLINQEIGSRENLNEHLLKAGALAQISLSSNFLTNPESILYSYLWALSDIIDHAKFINDQSLNILLKQRSFCT